MLSVSPLTCLAVQDRGMWEGGAVGRGAGRFFVSGRDCASVSWRDVPLLFERLEWSASSRASCPPDISQECGVFVPVCDGGLMVIRAPTKFVALLSLQREPSIDLLQAFVEHWKGITHYYIESTGGACFSPAQGLLKEDLVRGS